MTKKERIESFKIQWRMVDAARKRNEPAEYPNPANYGFVSNVDKWEIERIIGSLKREAGMNATPKK